MASTGETALAALFAALPGVAGVNKFRNATDTVDVPAGGLIVLRDGDRGEPIEEQLNPPAAVYRHAARIEIYASGIDDAARTAAVDALARAIQTNLIADRLLGGAVDWAELRRGAVRDEVEDGAVPIRIEDAIAILEYQEDM
ncbi:MAG: acyl-CoA transferase [Tagaea sp.]|nr:acyl-CoA transferase [Tagaea sp.]